MFSWEFWPFERSTIFFKYNIEKKYYIYYAIFVINGIATELFVALTIYYFSLTHFVLSSFISPILLYIIGNIIDNKYQTYILIINYIGFIIELFAILIFNEIIVLNFWGLNENTRKGINDREKEEHKKMDLDESCVEENTNEKTGFEIDGYYIRESINDFKEKNENENKEKTVELKSIND